jgi:hypothetical protein
VSARGRAERVPDFLDLAGASLPMRVGA